MTATRAKIPTIAEPTRLNLNRIVRFSLTRRGRELMQASTEDGYARGVIRENQDGTYWCSLWELMHVFGPLMVMGSEPPIETDVVVEPDPYELWLRAR